MNKVMKQKLKNVSWNGKKYKKLNVVLVPAALLGRKRSDGQGDFWFPDEFDLADHWSANKRDGYSNIENAGQDRATYYNLVSKASVGDDKEPFDFMKILYVAAGVAAVGGAGYLYVNTAPQRAARKQAKAAAKSAATVTGGAQ